MMPLIENPKSTVVYTPHRHCTDGQTDWQTEMVKQYRDVYNTHACWRAIKKQNYLNITRFLKANCSQERQWC